MLQDLHDINPLLPTAAAIAVLLVVVIAVDFVAKRILLGIVRAFAARTAVAWDDTLVEHGVFDRLAHLVPAAILYVGVAFVPGIPEGAEQVVRNVAMGYMVLMLTFALSSMLGAAHAIYDATPVAKERPLKGFVQLVQIVVWVLGGVLIVATVIDRSPLLLLSGFGAMTAVLLLVFKDTILSLVASVQLTAQDMVRVGDWIEVPQFGADGDVVDVQLHTVKVQNWDKTITTIPTHRLISDSFKNWRGMSDSGMRRIKRAMHVDLSSVRFLSREEIDRYRRFALLTAYIGDKQQELDAYNAALPTKVAADVNHRRLTNIGTFRAYALNYLRNHPKIHADATLIVRQLAPGPEGVPLEIYCFTITTVWADYEDIQSDIFDHLLAIIPEFGLRLFQQPAGADFGRLEHPSPVPSTAESTP